MERAASDCWGIVRVECLCWYDGLVEKREWLARMIIYWVNSIGFYEETEVIVVIVVIVVMVVVIRGIVFLVSRPDRTKRKKRGHSLAWVSRTVIDTHHPLSCADRYRMHPFCCSSYA